MWIDIDHMQDYKDFTFDSVNFPIEEMKNLVDYLHKNDKHLVLIVDPGIKVEKGYFAYDIGMEKFVYHNELTLLGIYLLKEKEEKFQSLTKFGQVRF